ncbi:MULTISPECIES: hypothetical protein [Rhodopirellula]|jgi:hypothetical protein|uniref:hypothetical protein n=1 Tax=Rhodopirellula TaxID=265488 RepID=UPI0011819E50|nr:MULTISPECIES: hypothetical protein [Rhodopirellula]
MSPYTLIADRNSPTNVWLRENPLVISLVAGVLGIALVYFGVVGLKTGATKDKYGNEVTGGVAVLSSVARLIGGIGAIGVAVYVAIFGVW